MYWVPPPSSLAHVVVNNRLFLKQGRRQRPTAERFLRASCMWHGMHVATFRHRSILVYIHRTIKQIKQKILAIHKVVVLSKITICGCARRSRLSTLTCHEITGLLLTRNLRDMNYGNHSFVCRITFALRTCYDDATDCLQQWLSNPAGYLCSADACCQESL